MKSVPESRMLRPDRTQEHNTSLRVSTSRGCWFPTAKRSTTHRFRVLSAHTIDEKRFRVEDAGSLMHPSVETPLGTPACGGPTPEQKARRGEFCYVYKGQWLGLRSRISYYGETTLYYGKNLQLIWRSSGSPDLII